MFVLDELCFESPFRVTRRDLQRSAHAANSFVSIAEDAGVLAGFVIANFDVEQGKLVGYIVTLDVRDAWRRQGLGTELMRQVEADAIDRGGAAIVLHVHVGNSRAIRVYEKLGYVLLRVEIGFYARGVDAFLFRKKLAT